MKIHSLMTFALLSTPIIPLIALGQSESPAGGAAPGAAGGIGGGGGGRGRGRGGPVNNSPEQLALLRQNGVRNATVHDPSTIIKCGDDYYTFYTGNNCPSWKSKDLFTWTNDGPAFTTP